MCTKSTEGFINSKILINHFQELCKDFLPPCRDDNAFINHKKFNSNSSILYFLSQMERLIKEDKCDAETFKNGILKIKLDILHIEILWYLEISNLTTLSEFIEFHERNNNTEIIQHISECVHAKILEYKTKHFEVRKQMLIDYTKAIFDTSADKLESKNKCSLYNSLLNLLSSSLQQFYQYENSSDFLVEKSLDMPPLLELFSEAKLDSEVIKLFFYQILNSLLRNSHQKIKTVFQKQEKMKNNVRDKKIFEFFTAISKFYECNDLITHLKDILSEEEVTKINWQNLLPLITFLGANYQNGWDSLKILTNSFVKQSFQNLDVKLLTIAFLIARQGCFEKGNKYFPSYLQWFSSTFSSESASPINSKESCIFFFNFLTELVTFDSSYYLKVHINRSPWVPKDSQSFLAEYATLVKTKLCDLNISTELGICENTTNKSAAVFDVENVMKHFERSNEILSSVFQAAMFCKGYYEKKFLAELLSKYEGKKSVRHKLILKLHSYGKIPNLMFKNYKSLEKKS